MTHSFHTKQNILHQYQYAAIDCFTLPKPKLSYNKLNQSEGEILRSTRVEEYSVTSKSTEVLALKYILKVPKVA